MSDSPATTRRVALVATEYAFYHTFPPTSLVLLVSLLWRPVIAWAVVALAVSSAALLARLLAPRARALIELESAALEGLNPAAKRYVKGLLWGRWGLSSSVMGLNRTLLVFIVLAMTGSAVAISLGGDLRFAIALLAIGLVLLMPVAVMWSLQQRAQTTGVVSGVVAYARGQAADLQQPRALLLDSVKAGLWADPPV